MTAFWIQNVVIAAALAVVVRLITRAAWMGPVGRHALWTVVLVKLITPPLVVVPTTLIPAVQPPQRLSSAAPLLRVSPRAPATAADTAAGHATALEAPVARAITSTQSFEPDWTAVVSWLFRVWIAGAIVFALVQAARIRRMSRVVAESDAPDRALSALVTAVAGRLRVDPINVRVSAGVPAPLIWCGTPWRPTLVWPARMPLDASSATSATALVTHELAHVKRRDHWIGWIELVAGVLWWWNPLFWFVRSRVRENAELACDAWVIETLPDGRRAYAEALLAVCDYSSGRIAPMPAVGVTTGNRRFLERRLVMIMQDRVPVRLTRMGVLSVAVAAAIAVPVWAASQSPVISGVDPQQVMPVTTTVRPVVSTRVPIVSTIVPVTVQTTGDDNRVVLAEVRPEQKAQNERAWVIRSQVPEDAQKVIRAFEEAQNQIRKEADERINRQKEEVVKSLQALQDSYAKAGKLDEAVAIRDRIRQLNENREWLPGWTARGGDMPLTLDREPVQVSGDIRVERPVTRADRIEPVAPVARDERRFAEGGMVRAELPSRLIEPIAPVELSGTLLVNGPSGTLPMLTQLRGRVGQILTVEVTGAAKGVGSVWGTDVYTDDSSIAAAAVHAGLLKPGETGVLKLTVLAGRDHYEGSTRNGVASADFRGWEGSFKLEKRGGDR